MSPILLLLLLLFISYGSCHRWDGCPLFETWRDRYMDRRLDKDTVDFIDVRKRKKKISATLLYQ